MKRSLWSSDQVLRSWYIAAFQLPVLPELALRGPGLRAFERMLERSGLDAAHAEAYAAKLREPGVATAAINWYRAVPFSRADDLGPSKVPTLYVYGTADFALGPRAAELTADHVEGPYRFVPLEGEGHWIPECAPETVADLLLTHAAAAA